MTTTWRMTIDEKEADEEAKEEEKAKAKAKALGERGAAIRTPEASLRCACMQVRIPHESYLRLSLQMPQGLAPLGPAVGTCNPAP